MHQQVLTKFATERIERYVREASVDRIGNPREPIDPKPRPSLARPTRAERFRPVTGSAR